jgi:hypothetical protein
MLGDKKIAKSIVYGMIILNFTSYLMADEKEEKINAPRPEERKSSIPNDTFSPSENVSEDYPVPFPTDI